MKKILLLIATVFMLSSCMTTGERQGAQTLRNIHNLTLAHKQSPGTVSATEIVSVIEVASDAAANQIDPKGEAPATVTVSDILTNKSASFKKIVVDASTVPPTDWGWLATVGGGILVAAGMAGKLLGPPWNLAGSAAEMLGRKLVPNYEETKQAAVGLIVATDSVLSDYGDILDAAPETKKILTEKLGMDPVTWFKTQLQKANTDNGTQAAISNLMELTKTHLTTTDGVLSPQVHELDSFLAKNITNLK